jgi:hypothetical protein
LKRARIATPVPSFFIAAIIAAGTSGNGDERLIASTAASS